MSSRSRLVLLVGVVALGAGIWGIFALMREDASDPGPDARAYLAAWEDEDWDGMAGRVVDAPDGFVDAHQAVVDNLDVTEAAYELDSVDAGGDTAVARFTATLTLAGLGDWSYDGTLEMSRSDAGDGPDWLVDWRPATIHPKLVEATHLTRTRQFPERAPILDANGQPLQVTGPGRLIGLEPRAVTDLNLVKTAFQQTLGIDPAAIDAALGAPGVEPDHFVPITSVDKATYDGVAAVIYPLPGTRFRDVTLRNAPSPNFAAHVLGRYGEATAERLEELGAPYEAGDLVGLSGLEAAYEAQLAGTPSGEIRVARDADDQLVEVVGTVEGTAPRPLSTTLDPVAQAAVEAALGDTTQPAAVVVVDSGGNVRAVASRPLGEFNRALAGGYAPGSTFKVVTTEGLLGRGVTPDTPVECTQTVDAGGRQFKNFESSSLGTVPFGTAFAQSCNTAFISASAANLSGDDLRAAAEQFGFNTDYSVGLDTVGGSFPAVAGATEQAAASIGQGKVTVSPLHMATVAAAVIDGTWEPPVLLPDADAGGRPSPTALTEGTAGTIHDLMRRVVAEGSGTAAAVPGADIAGKTGTAEFGEGTPPPTHAWFVGIRGDLAVAVLVENGGVGGQVAAPLAGLVLAGLPG
ncbi:MAG TPA: penicillin-binding transpeptidase domain-containing protein [Acidimicrobiales bacterium]|nr:penicillin-binding transpeptidase domain-containing protein [Acidimicrobiales bacterium]